MSVFVNTAATTQVLHIGTQTITLPAATVGSSFVRVEVTNGALAILGVTLAADRFVFEKFGSTVTVSVNNLTLKLGDTTPALAEVTISSATLNINEAGITTTAPIAATVNLHVPGVTFTGGFLVTIDSAAGAFTIASTSGVTLNVPGLTLNGDFVLQQSIVNGHKIVTIGIDNLNFTLGGFVSVTDGQGAVLVNSAGVAASFVVSASFTIPGVALTFGVIRVELNTGSAAVNDSVMLPSGLVVLNLPAGPFVQVTAASACKPPSAASRSRATSPSRRTRSATSSSPSPTSR